MIYKKTIREINTDYLEYIRSLPCLICNKQPPSHPHHTKTRGSGGSDLTTIPLCFKHHREVHIIGKKTFQKKYDIVFNEVIRGLNERYRKERA